MRTERSIVDLNNARNLMVEYREEIREAFKRAVRQTLLEHKRAGNPIAAIEGGELVWIAAEDITVDESD